MHKKGQFAGIPIPIILGIVVILIVSGGLLWSMGGGIAQKIFGERGILPIMQGNQTFVPYQLQLTESDRIAINSMNALVCAINAVSGGSPEKCEQKDMSIAAGTIGNEIQGAAVAETGTQETCNAQFGNACVKCGQPTILGTDKRLIVADLGKMIEQCALKTNFADVDTYCGYVLGGKFDAPVTKEELVQWLKTQASPEVRAAINTKFWIDMKPEVLKPEGGYHICADDDGDNEIYIYDRVDYDNDCKDSYDAWKKEKKGNLFATECIVKSFELPQKIEKVGIFNPVSWVAGNNDPDYVAYFEAFPRGMEKFWQVDEMSIVSVSLVVGFAVFDAIPGVGRLAKGLYKGFKTGAKETAEAMAEKTVREGFQQFFEMVGKRGWKNTIRTQFIEDFAEGYAYGIEKDLAKKVSGKVDDVLLSAAKRKITRAEATKELEESLVSLFDASKMRVDPGFLDKTAKEIAEGAGKNLDTMTVEERQVVFEEVVKRYRKQVASELSEQSAELYSKRMTKGFARELARRMAVKNFFKEMVKEGAEEVDKEAVQASIKKTLRKFVSLPEAEREKAVQAGIDLSEQFMTKEGLLDFTKITGRSFIDPDMATRKMTSQFVDAIATDQGTTLAEYFTRAGWGAARGIKRGTVGPHNPLTEPFKFFGDQIPISFGKLGLDTVPKAAQWINNHKYPIIAALAFYAAAADAANEKFEPVGMNSLALTRPYLRGEPKAFPMQPTVTPYYITPQDQGGNVRTGERLYLASPCKADLTVQTQLCECNRVPLGVQHWKFADDMPKLDVTGINPNLNALENDEFIYANFVKWHTNDQFQSAYLTMPEDEAIKKIKNEKLSARNTDPIYKKYTFLWEFNPDYATIKTRKEAIAAWQRLEAVDFFEKTVNGLALGAVNGYGVLVGVRSEESKDGLPQVTWDEFSAYYDFSGMQKTCVQRDVFTEYIDWIKMDYTIIAGQEIKIQDNVFAHPVYKTDCITVGITRDPKYRETTGANYCIDEYPFMKPVRWALFGIEITASIALTAMTGGTAAPFLIASTGIVSGLTEELLTRETKWPAYNTEAALNQVPIAQKTVSEAEWSALGGPRGT